MEQKSPETHSAASVIVRRIQELIRQTKDLPAWGPFNEPRTTPFSTAWEVGGSAICSEFGLTPIEFLIFVRYVRGAKVLDLKS